MTIRSGHMATHTSVAALVAAAAGILLAGCSSQAPAPSPADFLKEQGLQGKVALIEFGLIGCVLSDSGLDRLIALHRDQEIEDLVYLRVESETDAATVEAYYAAKAPGFPVVHDAAGTVGRAFEAMVIPTFVLVDKFAHTRYRGPMPDVDKLRDWADTLDRETTDPGPAAPLFGVTRVAMQQLLDETRLPDLGGAVKPLRAYMGKQGMLAVFVDSSCPFSGMAVQDMAQVAATLAKRDVSSLLVNLAQPKDTVAEFFGQRDTGTPVLYDVTTATQEQWKVDSVPTVVLFGADGTVGYRGKALWRNLAEAVEGLLKLEAGTIDFGVQGTEYG